MRALPFFVVLVLPGFFGCKQPEPPAATPAPAETNTLHLTDLAMRNAKLEVVDVSEREVQPELLLQGDVVIMEDRVATIPARVKGMVTKIHKKLGDKVRKGEVIATIESRDLVNAKMAYFEAEHTLEFARKALDREQQLLANKVSSKEDLQKKRHAVEEAEIEHASTLQRLRILGFGEEQLHTLKKNLDKDMTRFSLRAPFAGEVIKKSVTVGQSVEEEQEIFVVADLTEVWVEVALPMRSVKAVKPDMEVKVLCDTAEITAQGRVKHIASLADKATRTVPVRIAIKNSSGQWRPGMPARVQLTSAPLKLKLALPAAAVHVIDEQQMVFVQTEKASFQARRVEIGYQDEKVVEIVKGLAAQDRVAAKNSFLLKAEWLNREGA